MKSVKDIEQAVFGYSTDPRSRNQRFIRRILREANYSVGRGRRYLFNEESFENIAKIVRDAQRKSIAI